jgi:hypothetical protein
VDYPEQSRPQEEEDSRLRGVLEKHYLGGLIFDYQC